MFAANNSVGEQTPTNAKSTANVDLPNESFAAKAAPTRAQSTLVGVPGNRRCPNGVVQGRTNQPQMLTFPLSLI